MRTIIADNCRGSSPREHVEECDILDKGCQDDAIIPPLFVNLWSKLLALAALEEPKKTRKKESAMVAPLSPFPSFVKEVVGTHHFQNKNGQHKLWCLLLYFGDN
jgi:hypothetical protein